MASKKKKQFGLSLGLSFGPSLGSSEQSEKIKEIEQIRQIYDEYKNLFMQKEEFDLIERKLRPNICNDVIGSGDKKTIKICTYSEDSEDQQQKSLNITYIVGSDNEEILRHLLLLKIYYENGGLSLGFKIPKIYLKFNEDKTIDYYMDYIKITEKENKILGKFHYTYNSQILTNIGKILGIYANIKQELIYDFEIYRDENDGIYTLLDFGEIINLKLEDHVGKYKYTKEIYDGILETYIDKEKIKFYIESQEKQSKDEYLEALGMLRAKQKYLKYKKKYLKLKQQLKNI